MISVGIPPGMSQTSAFDVASVKPHGAAAFKEQARETIESPPGSLTMRNVSLASCMKWAYQVKDYQISGPAFLNSEKFDISARSAVPAQIDEMRRMLQALLRERFQLRVHRETRELPIYGLVVARSGPKFHKAESDGHTDLRRDEGTFVFSSKSMAAFAEDLSTFVQVDRPVLDRTGIEGVFDFRLKLADSALDFKRVMREKEGERDGPSIFTMIQEQLGLKLDAEKGLIVMLIVDHAARTPTAN